MKQLAGDKDIVILPVDKGRATVVMNRSDYSAKMQAMLDDRDTYQPLSKDPTSSLESKMNHVLLKLRREERPSDRTYDQLRSSAGRVPRLYGLPKIHKPDTPLRPIVSFLSKFLASLLKPVVGLFAHHVRNSQDFAQFIKSQRLSETEILVSFDVMSLFTRVLTDFICIYLHLITTLHQSVSGLNT